MTAEPLDWAPALIYICDPFVYCIYVGNSAILVVTLVIGKVNRHWIVYVYLLFWRQDFEVVLWSK